MPQQISKFFTQYSVAEYLITPRDISPCLLRKLILYLQEFKLQQCKKFSEDLSKLLNIDFELHFELSGNGFEVFRKHGVCDMLSNTSLLHFVKSDNFKTTYSKLINNNIEDTIAIIEFVTADESNKKSEIRFTFTTNEISFEKITNSIISNAIGRTTRMCGGDNSKLNAQFDSCQSTINHNLLALAYTNIMSVLNEITANYNKIVNTEITPELIFQFCDKNNIVVLEDNICLYISHNNQIIFLDFLNTKQ